jgi:1-acyl-sn-glycerol-3-phosphate acyltransferase
MFSLAAAFVPDVQTRTAIPSKTILQIAIPGSNVDTGSFQMSKEEINPLLSFGEGAKEKVVNAHGIWCFIVSLFTGPIWLLAMSIVHKKGDNDENRAQYDMTGKIWSKAWLTMTDSYPTVSGNLDRLKAGNEAGACLFVANHASWLDIPVLCTVLDPVFKFIAKGELRKVPCIGDQLEGVSFLRYQIYKYGL